MSRKDRKPKIPRVKSDKPRIKIRKTWTRNPAEQVVENKRERKPTKRKLRDDALEEYNEE